MQNFAPCCSVCGDQVIQGTGDHDYCVYRLKLRESLRKADSPKEALKVVQTALRERIELSRTEESGLDERPYLDLFEDIESSLR